METLAFCTEVSGDTGSWHNALPVDDVDEAFLDFVLDDLDQALVDSDPCSQYCAAYGDSLDVRANALCAAEWDAEWEKEWNIQCNFDTFLFDTFEVVSGSDTDTDTATDTDTDTDTDIDIVTDTVKVMETYMDVEDIAASASQLYKRAFELCPEHCPEQSPAKKQRTE